MRKLVFFDTETGGLDVANDAITQIAAVAVTAETYEELDAFEAKLAIGRFSSFLRDHSTRACVSRRGKEYFVADLAGHNAAAFDVPFLRRYYSTFDEFFPAWPIPLDTLQLARWWVHLTGAEIENLKLETLAAHFGMSYEAHDALADVRINVAVAQAIAGDLEGWSGRTNIKEKP